jgi:hypothetical protein
MASALAADGKGRKSTIIKNLLRLEYQKVMYSKLGRITKKRATISTSHQLKCTKMDTAKNYQVRMR